MPMMKSKKLAGFAVLLLLLPQLGVSFCRHVSNYSERLSKSLTVAQATMSSDDSNESAHNNDERSSSARRMFFQTLALSSTSALWIPETAFAAAGIGTSPDRPVAILGAGGKTGMEVATALANEGLYAVTMSRTGRNPFQVVKLKPEVGSFIQHYTEGVNVVQKEALKEALTKVHPSAIVFCASASRQGGTAFEVDDEGVGNAAEVARDLNAKFILISALAVDRPNSKSFQITNTLGGNYQGIMDAKFQGENKVRSLMKNYVIIRPGVLMNGKSRNGSLDIELNQGDQIGGGMSRDELAGVVVGALKSDKRGVTVEVYRRSTAMPLQPAFTIPSGREATSDSYVGLFENTVPDAKL